MLRIFLAVASVVSLLVCFGLGGWYLTHPESWNSWTLANRSVESRTERAPPAAPVVVEARFTAKPVPTIASSPQIPSRTTEPQTAAPAFSEDVTPATCTLPSTVSVTRREGSVLYTWRDERGVLNITTDPPSVPTIPVRTARYWADPEYFDLSVEYRGSAAVVDFETELSEDATAIYKIFAGLIGEENLRKVNLNVVLYPDFASYVDYAGSVTGRNMSGTAGFYSSRTNEAVTYVQNSREGVMRTARHESTHLIAAGMLGTMPIWLHEGLAVYFSALEVDAQSSQVIADERALNLARGVVGGDNPRQLRNLLSLTSSAWRDGDESEHYALSGGLIFFMMSSRDGRGILSSLLKEVVAEYCQDLDTTDVLNRLYPGGVNRLQRDYSNWLLDGRSKPAHVF